MSEPRQDAQAGLAAIEMLTTLLQRRREAHPTMGLYEAAELQWWWNRPMGTDELDQLFWLDADGRPEAAAAMFDFRGEPSLVYDNVTFCPFVLPDAAPDFVAQVVDRGLGAANSYGFLSVDLEVERSDEIMQTLLTERGFTVKAPDVLVEAWLAINHRPSVSPLHEGYRLASRSETLDRPHYCSGRSSTFDERRLNELSLYRPEFDLVVIDSNGNDAGHCLFWFDPVTSTGVVEPMRVNDDHQQRGLARHLLTSGVELLARAGATRVSIGYEPENPASGKLYRSVGFQDTQRNDLYSGPTA